VYFCVVYENESMTHTMIQSWEYLGPGESGIYRFRALNPFAVGDAKPTPYDGEFELDEKNVKSLVDLSGLIDHLSRLQRNGPGRVWAD
jgi:hypothetical protein